MTKLTTSNCEWKKVASAPESCDLLTIFENLHQIRLSSNYGDTTCIEAMYDHAKVMLDAFYAHYLAEAIKAHGIDPATTRDGK